MNHRFTALVLLGLLQFASSCNGAQAAKPSSPLTGTKLLEAIKKHHNKEAMRLINDGAFVDFQDPAGNTPLHYGAGLGWTEIVRLLVKCRARVNLSNNELDTPLHWAALGGHAESLTILISGGARIDSRSKSGETPLHLAVDKGHMEAVRLLVENHASVNMQSATGKTVLDYVHGQSAIQDYLTSKGAVNSAR